MVRAPPRVARPMPASMRATGGMPGGARLTGMPSGMNEVDMM